MTDTSICFRCDERPSTIICAPTSSFFDNEEDVGVCDPCMEEVCDEQEEKRKEVVDGTEPVD